MITILYIYKNKEAERVKRSLHTLLSQTDSRFKVLLIDYGSEIDKSNQLQNLLKQYTFVDYIYSYHLYQPWSRAKAINIGLQNISTPYVFVADIDMLFNKEFIATLNEIKSSDRSYYFKVGFLSEKETKINKEFDDYFIAFTSKPGAQGLSLFPTEALFSINGFDEFFHFWGGEDIDVHERLTRIGIESVFYNKEILLLHQWHKSYRTEETNILSEDLQLKGVVRLNHQHLKSNQKNKATKVNDGKWGNLISKSKFNELEKCDHQITLNNKVEVIDHFLFVELPRLKDTTQSIEFVVDAFQNSLKYNLKKLLGKNVPKFYSLKEINDMLLLHIVSFYHTCPYYYKISKDLKSITFKIKK